MALKATVVQTLELVEIFSSSFREYLVRLEPNEFSRNDIILPQMVQQRPAPTTPDARHWNMLLLESARLTETEEDTPVSSSSSADNDENIDYIINNDVSGYMFPQTGEETKRAFPLEREEFSQELCGDDLLNDEFGGNVTGDWVYQLLDFDFPGDVFNVDGLIYEAAAEIAGNWYWPHPTHFLYDRTSGSPYFIPMYDSSDPEAKPRDVLTLTNVCRNSVTGRGTPSNIVNYGWPLDGEALTGLKSRSRLTSLGSSTRFLTDGKGNFFHTLHQNSLILSDRQTRTLVWGLPPNFGYFNQFSTNDGDDDNRRNSFRIRYTSMVDSDYEEFDEFLSDLPYDSEECSSGFWLHSIAREDLELPDRDSIPDEADLATLQVKSDTDSITGAWTESSGLWMPRHPQCYWHALICPLSGAFIPGVVRNINTAPAGFDFTIP